MNADRIEQLAHQAGFVGTSLSNTVQGTLHRDALANFAELIEKEINEGAYRKIVQAEMCNPAYAQAMDAYYENKWAHRFD